MPAIPFDATAHRLSKLAVQTLVPLEASVFEELQAEDFLLIQSCLRSGSSERLQEVDKDGNLVLDVHFNQKLTYAVTAKVLEFDGLADYHPGRALNDRLLSFANGRRAFQFTQTGKLIYLDPRQTLPAGDLPGVEFTVENIFIDLDDTAYPTTFTVTYLDLDAQESAVPPTAARAAVLSDVFLATELCSGDVALYFYDGDPAGAGVLKGSAASAAWSTVTEPVTANTSVAESPAVELTGNSEARHITHVRVMRPGLTVLDITLDAAVDLPAWQYLRLSAGDLLGDLTWPCAGDPGAWTRPNRLALQHLLGVTTTGITPSATMTVKAWDGDPDDSGTLLDTITVDRDADQWRVLDNTLINEDAITGVSLAPPGGWAVTWVTVELSGVSSYFIKQDFSGGAINVLEGDPIVIIGGQIELELT